MHDRSRGLRRQQGAVLAFLAVLTIHAHAAAQENFHNGSIGRCEGCHGRPASSGQAADEASEGFGQPSFMLKGADASSTCLMCHEAPAGLNQPRDHYVASNGSQLTPGMPPSQLTPAGDFGWLKKSYRWMPSEGQGQRGEESSPGERHGHNIVALEFGYMPDGRNAVAPGGTYPSQALSCTSCHDPHGDYKRFPNGIVVERGNATAGSGSYNTSQIPTATRSVGVYRLLAGKGYRPKVAAGVQEFLADPPAAVAPVSYNRSERAADTRVAYGSGMSEWCQNCHQQIHGSGSGLGHPTGRGARLTGQIAANYNAYVGSGNINGAPAEAYTSMVPFEMGTDDYTVLTSAANSDGSYRKGAEGGSPQVMCLTCHRAHASGWDSMTRWNTHSEFIVHNGRYPGIDTFASAEFAQGRTTAEVSKTFYDRKPTDYASYQRSLCNKCHVKD